MLRSTVYARTPSMQHIGPWMTFLSLFVMSCVETPTTDTPASSTLVVSERYGEAFARGLQLKARMRAGDPATAVGIASISLETQPASPEACRKLEAALGDTRFDLSSPGDPKLVGSISPEVAPLANRLELGLAVADSERSAGPRDRVAARLFESPPTMGITRIIHREGEVSVHSLSLVSTGAGNVVSWGSIAGESAEGEVVLQGMRTRLGSGTREPIELFVSHHNREVPP